jgi:pyruvate kinase
VTRGGKTARVLSALRPSVPIYAATDDSRVQQRLTLSWGVAPVLTDLSGDLNAAASRIGQALVEHGEIPRASPIVLVSVTPDLAPGPSNFLKLQRA